MEMKRNSGIVLTGTALGAALVITLGGCAQQDDSYIPAKRAGFRPQSTPLMQDAFGTVDPLAVPSGSPNHDSGSGFGFVGNSAPVAPLPDTLQKPRALVSRHGYSKLAPSLRPPRRNRT